MPPVISFQDPHPPADPYRPDAAKIIDGDPVQRAANLFASPDGRFNCGVWTGAVGSWHVHFTETELCHLLDGVVVLTADGGEARTFRAGDAFVVPAGFRGIWAVLEPAKKLYAVYE